MTWPMQANFKVGGAGQFSYFQVWVPTLWWACDYHKSGEDHMNVKSSALSSWFINSNTVIFNMGEATQLIPQWALSLYSVCLYYSYNRIENRHSINTCVRIKVICLCCSTWTHGNPSLMDLLILKLKMFWARNPLRSSFLQLILGMIRHWTQDLLILSQLLYPLRYNAILIC